MPQITEFIYFKVKPSVRPEDPSSEDGEAFLKALNIAKQQSGHQNSVWGRAVEDQDTIVWAVGGFAQILVI